MLHVMHVLFLFIVAFNNLKSTFSEDNMPVHALDVFIENATKMVYYPIKHKKGGSNFKVTRKLCIFLYNAMETTGVRQGMGIMHSDVMDTIFHGTLSHKIKC